MLSIKLQVLKTLTPFLWMFYFSYLWLMLHVEKPERKRNMEYKKGKMSDWKECQVPAIT